MLIGAIVFWSIVGILILKSNYDRYHNECHGEATWGQIQYVHINGGKSGGYVCEIAYTIDNKAYICKTGMDLPERYLMDSVIVIYDKTYPNHSFVLLKNPKDLKSAFFKSRKDYMPHKWQIDYIDCISRMEEKCKAHLNREHWYDYLCRDDN